jgi:L-fuconate dehydratase
VAVDDAVGAHTVGVDVTIAGLDARDIRFPTSHGLDGSDAMNRDPDYSVAYVMVRTSDPAGPIGHGFTFTIGRGTEVVLAAIDALEPLVVGASLSKIADDMGGFWRHMVGDSQLRWIGPEKGAIHLATAAIVNAVWDLIAKRAGKPLWRLLTDMEPAEFVDLVDWRYLTDVLTRQEALELIAPLAATKNVRAAQLMESGYPAYTTSVGWLGYSDEKIEQLCRTAMNDGWTRFKMKVGGSHEDDARRARMVRAIVGPSATLAMDANQRWDVAEAIDRMADLTTYDPYWIEEPTHPDDIVGHRTIREAISPIRVATGEHVPNAVVFKQYIATGAIDVCQIDACRMGGVNEVLAVLLIAAKFGVPVCPHAGGVGLCELVQHLSIVDYIAISGRLDGRMIEYVDHLHEHFVDPVVIDSGAYRPPIAPGYSAEIKADTLTRFAYPHGEAWARSP